MKKKSLSLTQRVSAPTSKFFRIIRNTGLCLVAAGTALISATVTLPPFLTTLAGYLIVAGTVMTAIAQITVEGE